MVENGWYLLCPDCRKLSDAGWFEQYDATIYKYYQIDPDGSLWGEEEESYIDELVEIGHNCGFWTDEYDISDFRVLIRNNRIEDWGDYWDRHKDDLIEIAEELGLEIKLNKDDEDDEDDEIWKVNDIWTEL